MDGGAGKPLPWRGEPTLDVGDNLFVIAFRRGDSEADLTDLTVVRRRNAAYVRQGEWFFVPAPGFGPPDAAVLRNELLLRGAGSTPHVMQFAYRRGGTVVYVRRWPTTVISPEEYGVLTRGEQRNWSLQVRDPEVYAKGSVRHPDHATVHLDGWHRVSMNTEQHARAMQHVVFID